MTDKTNDLMNLAEKMRVLAPKEKCSWGYSLAHCREIIDPNSNEWQTYSQKRDAFQSFQRTIIRSLSFILTNRKASPWVKKGVESFMSATKEERKVFYEKMQQNSPAQPIVEQKEPSPKVKPNRSFVPFVKLFGRQ